MCDVAERTETKGMNAIMPRPEHALLRLVADRPGADAMPSKRPAEDHVQSARQPMQSHSPAVFSHACGEQSLVERLNHKVFVASDNCI